MNAQTILKQTNGGLDFYQHVIGHLTVVGDRCKNVHNPFYNDNNPSLSIYCKKGRWYYKDYGSPEDFSGDVFHFASHFYGLDIKADFVEILSRMASDLGIIDGQPISSNSQSISQSSSPISKYTGEFKFQVRGFDSNDENFWRKYNITSNILEYFNVIPISSQSRKTIEGNWSTFNYHHQLAYAYQFDGFVKIYCPEQKQKFFYLGQKQGDYIFGQQQLDLVIEQRKQLDYLIITGGEKDAMTLYAMGFECVISFNNETSNLPKDFIDKYSKKIPHKNIIVLYDNDDHGIKASEKICTDHGFTNYFLPEEAFNFEAKDISDFVAVGGTDTIKEEMNSLIKDLTVISAEVIESVDAKELCVTDEETEAEQNTDQFGNISEESLKSLPLAIRSFLFENNIRDRDLIYLGLLSISGALFNNVSTRYGQQQYEYPHLFAMIIAPQASGKGILKIATKILQKAIEAAQKKIGDSNRLMLSANSSTSSLIENLNNNKGVGIIFDTEADTLNNVFLNDWGNFSSDLRKAFHSEPLSLNRRKNNERLVVDKPKISVVLSGTPNQLSTLIKDKENGLLSRFIYYKFKGEAKWIDQFNVNEKMDEAANKLSEYFERIVELLVEKDAIIVKLKVEHQNIFNQFFIDLTTELDEYFPEHGASISKRFGVIAIKIIMVHTLWRFGYKGVIPDVIFAEEEDINSVLLIISCLKLHTIEAFKLIGSNISQYNNITKEKYLDKLPAEFTRDEANKLAGNLDIKLPTAEKYLTSFTRDKLIERVRHGNYKKRK